MADVKELNINNTTYDIKAKSVVDQNSGSLKYWSGTQAQYNAIATKDSNTIYNVEDTTSPVISVLDSLYPVGAIYIGTMASCPLQTLGIGTWQLVAQDRVLQGAGNRGSVGTTINESLPNIEGSFGSATLTKKASTTTYNISELNVSGAFSGISSSNNSQTSSTTGTAWFMNGSLRFRASDSSSTYQDDSPVQQNGYLVNIWERVA